MLIRQFPNEIRMQTKAEGSDLIIIVHLCEICTSVANAHL